MLNNNNMFPIAKLMNEDSDCSYLTTIDISNYDDIEDAQMVLNTMNNSENAVPVSAMINKVIELDEVAFFPASVTVDGVSYPAIRTVVITKDGEVFATNSKVFAESVAMTLNICGNPRSWKKPHYFKVQQIDLANARRCYKLVMAKK